ncbi:MAG: C-GCAxxG-C-C family protein [Candidatus Sedimenticola endophacoides]
MHDEREDPNRSPVERFGDGCSCSCSCSQAIVASHADRYGLDQRLALRIASGLGGGLGRAGGTCGAITGAALVLGLELGTDDIADKAAKERTYRAVRELQDRFAARHGTTQCRQLLGCDIADPAGYQRAREQGLFLSACPTFVASAAALLDELLDGAAR